MRAAGDDDVRARDAPRTVSTTTSTAPTVPQATVVVLAAVRGDCWFSARVGSESGSVLDERVLAQGESVRLHGEEDLALASARPPTSR